MVLPQSFNRSPVTIRQDKRLYTPPTHCKPLEEFHDRLNRRTRKPEKRYIRNNEYHKPSHVLIFVDGACWNNGQPDACAGYGVKYGPDRRAYLYGPLERSEDHDQTSIRAELRAAIAGIQAKPWHAERFTRLFVASDSEYVVKGISEWCPKWIDRGWWTVRDTPVANQDLWKCLLDELEKQDRLGVLVRFWWIPRKLNLADKYAGYGADKDSSSTSSLI